MGGAANWVCELYQDVTILGGEVRIAPLTKGPGNMEDLLIEILQVRGVKKKTFLGEGVCSHSCSGHNS